MTVPSGNDCPDLSKSLVCAPSSCPMAEFDASQQRDFAFCDGDADNFSLPNPSAWLSNGPNESIANETWTTVDPAHAGSIDQNGAYVPGVVTAPVVIEVMYEVEFAGEGCTYDTQLSIELYNNPIVSDLIPCLLYTSPSPRDQRGSRMPSSA